MIKSDMANLSVSKHSVPDQGLVDSHTYSIMQDMNRTHGLNVIDEPYELIWTADVVFRVTTIVVVMILTILGNLTLIIIITLHSKLRKQRVNVFLVNLAVGDLMVCLVTMTTEILFVAFG